MKVIGTKDVKLWDINLYVDEPALKWEIFSFKGHDNMNVLIRGFEPNL